MNFADVDHEVWVTRHALERLEEHYPGITTHATRGMLNRAIELDGDAVRPLLGRPMVKGQRPSRYFLPEQREGLMVIEQERGGAPHLMPWVMVTYLRLEASQQATINRLWPKDGAPQPAVAAPLPPATPATTKDDWVKAVRARLDGLDHWATVEELADETNLTVKQARRALLIMKIRGEVEVSGNTVPVWRARKVAA